jgi:hypothetical protein
MGVMMAAMVVAGAGYASAESFTIVERGSGNGASVLQGQFEDLPDEFTLGEELYGLADVCGVRGDTVLTLQSSGFFRRIATPSGEQTRQVFIRRDISFTQDGILYTGTLQEQFSFEDFNGTNGRIVSHLRAMGGDGSTFHAIVINDREDGVDSVRVVCPGA